MEFRPLNDIDLDELLNTFNESFSDYFVPLQLTLDQLKGRIKSDNINFSYSAGAFKDNKLIGFILHGYDIVDSRRVVYNAGSGVIPDQRKQGLTMQMYDYIFPTLRAEKIDYLVLEVIEQNVQAFKVYQKVGFIEDRKLVCYKGQIKATGNSEIIIRETHEYDWNTLKSFWDVTPAWQNSTRALDVLKDTNKLYGAFMDAQLVGYIVYNPQSKRVQQFAVDPKYRRKKIGSALFNHIGNEHGGNITIINVDQASKGTNEFLIKIGLENFVEQIEMKLELN